LVKTGDVNVLHRAINVNYDSYGKSCLGSCDSDSEESEEHTLQLSGEQETVEHNKVDIDSIEHELERYQDSDHVLASYKPEHTTAKHNEAGYEIENSC
jgi:hypothetical protein